MRPVTQVRCPGCESWLRIPTDWLGQHIRCKFCTKRFRARAAKRTEASAPRPHTPMGVPVARPASPSESPAYEHLLPPTEQARSPESSTGEEFAFDAFDDAGLSPLGSAARYRPARRSPAQAAVLIGIALVFAAIGIGVFLRGTSDDPHGTGSRTAADTGRSVEPPTKAQDPPTATVHFPRRLLAVGIHQYLYANPTSPGRSSRAFATTLSDLARKLHIDPAQVYVLSDSLTGSGARPPLKPIVEQTIERFLGTCRPQDRVMILFAGHAVDLDDQPYLVPLEGDLTAKETLIPLRWLYERLATCPARQKVLVMDVCRNDSGRGLERPGSGPMGPKLDAALANPPAGVQVWSSCVAGQLSHEFEYASHGSFTVEGGAFLSMLGQAFLQGGGAAKPEDPLPLAFLTETVHEPLRQLVRVRENAEQTPRLAGQEPAEGAAYDPAQSPPPRFELPKPTLLTGATAAAQDVEAIFREIAVPPLKLPRDLERSTEAPEQQAARLAALFPFSAETLKPYTPDYKNVREFLDKPQQHPLRVAVLRAVETLDRQGRLGRVRIGEKEERVEQPKEEFRYQGPVGDQEKKSLTESQKDGPAKMIVELTDVLELMERAGAERDKEPSRRWQAHYDYVLAQLKARLAYVHEYNTALAKVKRDELPPLDPKLHNGYRLASQEKIQSPREVKNLADDAKKLLNKLVQEHAGTPWEVLARRERFTALGLSWQPTNLGK